ncbi:MAG: class I SAM-dependent methyltransferase [candidate division Zixibacteria bacterium]|nr:class I SAM-dependent methyltransferase [candidate division Zixibacteria bacterium]
MYEFEKYLPKIKQKFPNYRFSWEILTDLMLEHTARKPYWLDIGAGANVLIEEQPGAEFGVGLDVEKPEKCFTDLKSAYCVASIYNIPLADNTFDFITSRYTFEHLEYPQKAFTEVVRVMKPGGTFIMQTTNVLNPLLFAARFIPFPIKKVILKKIFKDNPSGIFKTHYKINTPSAVVSLANINRIKKDLILEELILNEDILCQRKLLFTLTFQMYKLIRLFGADSLMGNIIAVFKKRMVKQADV